MSRPKAPVSTVEPGQPIRVIVADDQPLIRSAIRIMVEAHDDLALVAEAGDGRELLAVADAHPADVVLMDIRMPNLDGIAATRQLLVAHPGIRVIVLTTDDIDEYVVAAIRAGASGFLLRMYRPPGWPPASALCTRASPFSLRTRWLR